MEQEWAADSFNYTLVNKTLQINNLKIRAAMNVKISAFVICAKAIIYIHIHWVRSVQIRSFFWSVISCIRTKYGGLLCKSPYSVQIQENRDQKKLCIWTILTQWNYLKLYQQIFYEF